MSYLCQDVERKRPIPLPVQPQPFDEAAVESYCAGKNIACSVSCQWIFLRTPAASWRLEHDGVQILRVYHENLLPSRYPAKKKRLPGFHLQAVDTADVFRVIDYIEGHDRHYLRVGYPCSYVMRAQGKIHCQGGANGLY